MIKNILRRIEKLTALIALRGKEKDSTPALFVFLRNYPGLISLIGVSFVLAVYVPPSMVAENKWIWEFAGALGKVFPPVAAYIEKSEFPESTALYFSLVWPLSPMFYIWYMQHLKNTVKFGAPASTSKLVIFGVPIILLFYSGVYFILFVNPGYDFNVLPINRSRFALGAFGWIFAGGSAFVLLAYCVLLTDKLISILKQRFLP